MTEAPVAPAGAQGDAGGDDGGQERTFTQADLNKIAANEKREGTKSGRQAAINELLQQAGAESLDEVVKAYTEYKGVQEAVTTEADKARQRAERLENRAKTAEEQVKSIHREYALRDALRDSGINTARLPLALKIADMSQLEFVDGQVTGTDVVVEALKESSPEWFGEVQRPRVDAPQTAGTGVETPGAAPGDPQQDMGTALLGFLQQARSKGTTVFNQ